MINVQVSYRSIGKETNAKNLKRLLMSQGILAPVIALVTKYT